MSHRLPHVPEPARAVVTEFIGLLNRDGYGPPAAMRMIAAIVDHARAVRLRCDARAHLSIVEANGHYDESYDMEALGGCVAEQARIVHGLARHTTVMTRRGLPVLFVRVSPWELAEAGAVSEITRDAGHDLLASLICEVEASS